MRRMADAAFHAEQRRRVRDPHVAPVSALVEALGAESGLR